MAWVKCGIRVLGILDRNNNQLLVLKSILPGELVPLFSYVNLPLPVPCPLDQVPVLQLSCPVAQLCLTVCDPTDCNLPGSSVHGILQARTPEWAAISFTGDLPDPGIKPRSLASLEFADGFFGTALPGKPFFQLESEGCSVMSNSLRPRGLYHPWNSPGRNTGVGSLSLFQGIFPAQGSNPGLPHCGWILYQLSHKGSSRILEWVAYPFSRGSSLPRNRTGVSCIVEGLHCRRILYQLSYQGNSYVLIILGLNLLPKAFFFCIF